MHQELFDKSKCFTFDYNLRTAQSNYLMKKRLSSLLLIVSFLLCSPAIAQRSIINIDFNWHFHHGDLKNGEADTVDYSNWRTLDLPHDWSIEQQYARGNPGGGSYAFLPGGIGWYKYEFETKEQWSDKVVTVEFDGIFCNSTVWINGHKLGYRPNGYIGLNYNLTPFLHRNKKNILSVRVDNSKQPAARWYSGSGIYRHARFIVTDKIRVAHNGTYISTPEITPDQALVHTETTICNESGNPATVDVRTIILDPSGQEASRNCQHNIRLFNDSNSLRKTVIHNEITVPKPQLWSPDTPSVYKFVTEIYHKGVLLDKHISTFGIRKMEFDVEYGFRLNGKKMKFKGVCMHQNTGCVGAAIPIDLWHKRLSQLKKMGCNAIRTSHYAYPSEFYNLCDTMGFMVMNELFDGWDHWEGHGKAKYDYGHYFRDWWKQDLEEFIRRDRNHPCVMIWSLGNEVWGWEKHQSIQYEINEMFHRLDPTRPTTQAWALGTYIDIAGFNGNGVLIDDLERFHREQPDKLAIGTELPHTRQTRGVYHTIGSFKIWDKEPEFTEQELAKRFPLTDLSQSEIFNCYDPRYASGYDNQARWICVREQWKRTQKFDFFLGEFRWTAFDYLGESWGWPARTNNYGIIDLAGFPKDHYYLYQSLWSETPMVHLLPHWTHPGMEGTQIPVVVYTNGDEAELFLNNQSLGKKKMSPDTLQITWQVPYRPGTLTAVAYDHGQETARKSTTTAGKAASIRITADREYIHANRKDILCIAVDIIDRKGIFVPIAADTIRFEVSGSCKILGTENGDILDMTPAKSMTRKAFMGKALLMLQASDKPGKIRIKASAPGLKAQTVHIDSRSEPKP